MMLDLVQSIRGDDAFNGRRWVDQGAKGGGRAAAPFH